MCPPLLVSINLDLLPIPLAPVPSKKLFDANTEEGKHTQLVLVGQRSFAEVTQGVREKRRRKRGSSGSSTQSWMMRICLRNPSQGYVCALPVKIKEGKVGQEMQ